jgi:hypothetical protein
MTGPPPEASEQGGVYPELHPVVLYVIAFEFAGRIGMKWAWGAEGIDQGAWAESFVDDAEDLAEKTPEETLA